MNHCLRALLVVLEQREGARLEAGLPVRVHRTGNFHLAFMAEEQ